MQNNIWLARASRLFCTVIYTLVALFALKDLLPTALPILLSLAMGYGVHRLSVRISKALSIPKRLCAFTVITLFLALGVAGSILMCKKILNESTGLITLLAENKDSLLDLFLSVFQKSPALSGILLSVGTELEEALFSLLSNGTEHVAKLLAKLIKATPDALFSGAICILCCYYFAMDLDTVADGIKKSLAPSARLRISKFKNTLTKVFAQYLRAYLYMFILTFFELFIGLLILCPKYALTGALGIAIADALPIVGAGIALIPCSLYSFATGNNVLGAGFLILYVAVTVSHRIAEPHFLGESMGLHPLLAIISVYFGYKLSGFWGMLIAPAAVSVIFSAVRERQHQTANPPSTPIA